jgi:hypothetical protein
MSVESIWNPGGHRSFVIDVYAQCVQLEQPL